MKNKASKPTQKNESAKKAKLGLRRETLVSLSHDALAHVAGGRTCTESCGGTIGCTAHSL